MKDKRKFPRFAANVQVVFQDRAETSGTMVNASREGALIISKGGLKPINSFIAFLVLPTLNTSIKIVGKVVRHATHEGKNAMGIAFLELSSEDLTSWLDFLGEIRQDVEAIPVKVTNKPAPKNKHAHFTIRFLSRAKLKKFFPSSLHDEIYFTTTRIMKAGDKINIALIHPDNESILRLVAVVERYGKHPNKNEKQGLYCKVASPNKALKEKIQKFV